MEIICYASILCKVIAMAHFVQAVPGNLLKKPKDIHEAENHNTKPQVNQYRGGVFILNSEPLHVRIAETKTNENIIRNKIFSRSAGDIYRENPAGNMYYKMMSYIDDPINRIEQYLEDEQEIDPEKQNSLLDDLPSIENTSDQLKELKRVKRNFNHSEILSTNTKPLDAKVNKEHVQLFEDDGFLKTVEDMIALIDQQLKNKTQTILKRIARQSDFADSDVTKTVVNTSLPSVPAGQRNESNNEKSLEIASTQSLLSTLDPYEHQNVSDVIQVDGNHTTKPSVLEKFDFDDIDKKFIKFEQPDLNKTSVNNNGTSNFTIKFELGNTTTLQTSDFGKSTREHIEHENNTNLDHLALNKTEALHYIDSNKSSRVTKAEVDGTTTVYQTNPNKTLNQSTTPYQSHLNKTSTLTTLRTNGTEHKFESNVTNMPDQFGLITNKSSNSSGLKRAIFVLEKTTEFDKVILNNTMDINTENHNNENKSNDFQFNKTLYNRLELYEQKTSPETNVNNNKFMYQNKTLNLTHHVSGFNKTKISNNIIEIFNGTDGGQFIIKNISFLNETDNKRELSGNEAIDEDMEFNDKKYSSKTRDREDVVDMASESDDLTEDADETDNMMRNIQSYQPFTLQPDVHRQSHKTYVSTALTYALNVILAALLIYGVFKVRHSQVLSHAPPSTFFGRRPTIRRPNCPFVNIPLHTYTSQINEPAPAAQTTRDMLIF